MRYGSETVSFLNPLLSMFSILLLPALLLFAAGVLLEYGMSSLSAAQLGVLRFLPVLLLGGSLFIAFRFNRLRLYAATGNLLLAYALVSWLLPELDGGERTAALAWIAILAPINHLMSHILPDRGSHPGAHATMFGVVAVEGILVILTLAIPLTGIANLLASDVTEFLDPARTGLPDIGLVALGIMLMLSFARLYALVNTQRGALFASGFCLLLALSAHAEPSALLLFTSVGALVLIVAGFQESWNIAYLDQLTELPGRRALDEAMGKLEGVYSVAMVDVDHFKKFNDTYGHDVGDQVLRMVASRLRAVSGGGKAYRYGGEEFTVLFPGRGAEQAFPHVDDLREKIAGDSFELRQRDRREDEIEPDPVIINITVSAGLAERDGKADAESTIKSADEALYAAKRAGRNRVKTAK